MINYNGYVKKALYFSSEKHNGQYRKGGITPYIVHPVLVAFGVSKYTNDEEIIAAALLHDILEDCKDISIDFLNREFSPRIVQLVIEVSYLPIIKHDSWKKRKEEYIAQIERSSKDALLIIAIDKMINFQGYFKLHKSKQNASNNLFGGTIEGYYWYYSTIRNVLAVNLGNHPVVEDYTSLLNVYSR